MRNVLLASSGEALYICSVLQYERVTSPASGSGICKFLSNSKFNNIAIFPYILKFGQKNRIFLAIRSVLWPKTCRKCDSGRGSAPDPAGGAHDAPQTP